MYAVRRLAIGGMFVAALFTLGLLLGNWTPAQADPNPPAAVARDQARPRQVEIQKIEVNQAVGVQRNDGLKFVAGKPTVIRAFLAAEVTVDAAPEQTQAVILLGGQQVATLAAKSYDRPVKIVEFLCSDMAACGNWAAGAYVFNVKVNGVTKTSEGANYTFQDRARVTVLAIPVKGCFGGTIEAVSGDAWKQYNKFTEATYPVAPDKLIWEVRQEFDASDCSKYDLYTDKGGEEIWKALTALLPAECKANPKGPGCYDLIVGFVGKNPKSSDGKFLAGFTMGKPTNIVCASDADAAATVAHEVAHVYGIGDTYNGGSIRCSVNPAYPGATGTLWEGEADFGQCVAPKHAEYDTILVPESDNMYEVGGRGALPNVGDYMGSTMAMNDIWTSKFVYDYLFDKLAPGASVVAAADQRLVYYAGFITLPPTNTITVGPWETFMGTLADTGAAPGPYWIAALAGDTVVVTRTLEIVAAPPAARGNVTTVLSEIPFEGAMPFPAGTTKFQIFNGAQMLREVPVSANAPTVNNVTPATGGSYNSAFNITWGASDADNDTLSYSVEYNPDVTNPQSAWVTLIDGLTERQWAENFGELPGGAHAKVRVKASDGVLTGVAESAEFSVPFKAPEAFIQDPAWGYDYEATDEVALSVEAYDLQDDVIADNRIQWSSNVAGALGSGADIIVRGLPMGEHVISVRVTNSAGLSVTHSIMISMGSLTNEYIEYVAGSGQVVRLTNNWGSRLTTLDIPVRAVYTDTFVTYQHLKAPPGAVMPGMYLTGRNFNLSAWVSQAEEWEPVVFSSAVPMTLTVAYPTLPPNVSAGSLWLARWNGSAWVNAATECSPNSVYNRSVAGQITVGVCRFGDFALLGQLGAPLSRQYLPLTTKR